MSSSPFWTTVFAFAETTTHVLGTQLLKDFGQTPAEEKSDGSLVTRSDQWADQQLAQAIATTFPEHGFLSEESNHIFPNTDWCWIVDPIDGTTNFARGIPIWGISLGLCYQGTPVFGYVHLPPIAQSFYGFWRAGFTSPLFAEQPQGAFLNQQPIQPSAADPGANQLFNFCSRSTHLITPTFPCKARMLGGAAYNMLSVAAGTFLGAIERSPKIWDIAAVWVMVQAAGAVWIPLDPQGHWPEEQGIPLFPLISQQDYGRQGYPTLILSRPELIPILRPHLQPL
ncbi:MAG: inositol monophosphatase family protein [Cyanobacteriota bacterium]|nr:inositol monophosphatase family protein [Cyanobacteriota bacterium]